MALPINIFHPYCSYCFYEMVHCKRIAFSFLVVVISSLLHGIFHNYVIWIVCCISKYIAILVLFKAFLYFIQNKSWDFQVKLLLEIITHTPAVKGKEWRTISYNMNQYLFD